MLALKRSPRPTYCARFSPDGRRLVIGSEEGAKVCDALTGKELYLIEDGGGPVRSVDFSPNGQFILTAGESMMANLWDASSGAHRSTLIGHSAMILSAIFSPDGRRILTGGADHSVRLWDLAGSELLNLTEDNAEAAPIAFSPDGTSIAAGQQDGTALVWRSATSEETADWLAQEAVRVPPPSADQAAHQNLVVPTYLSKPLPAAGAIKRWLVLAPIQLANDDGLAALEKEQLLHEPQLQPRAAESVRLEGRELVWEAIESDDSWLYFNNVVGKVMRNSAAYAVCYLLSPSDQAGLLMHVACDDHAKVYLNDRLVCRSDPNRANPLEEMRVPGIELRAGINRLVLKVVNETGGWQGSVRITDSAEEPVPGLSVALAPQQTR